ncbi:hypothetical protein AtNW77_Chr1g0036931 [Arabidopsis thaliana]
MDVFGKSLLVDKSVFVARSAFVIGEQSQKQAICGDFVTMMSILIGDYRTLAAKATEQWLKRGG